MKATLPLSILLCSLIVTLAQPAATPRPPVAPVPTAQASQPAPRPPQDTANYIITVRWTNSTGTTNSLQVLTAEGTFTLDTIQSSVRIDDNDIPTTVSFNGTLTPLNPEKGILKVFLGRTVPYVTGSYSPGNGKSSSSYQQLRVGLNSTFTVTFGKPMVIQTDENGEVSIVVKRVEN